MDLFMFPPQLCAAEAAISVGHRGRYPTPVEAEGHPGQLDGGDRIGGHGERVEDHELAGVGGAILKYDRQNNTRTSIELGRGRVCGEAVFAPSASAKSEDDGYLMTYVYDVSSDTSEYVIFDAKTMSADPIATVQLPRVPFGFHGSWVPANVVS